MSIGKPNTCMILGLSSKTVDKIDAEIPDIPSSIPPCKKFAPQEILTFPDGRVAKGRYIRCVKLAQSLPDDMQELIMVKALEAFTNKKPIKVGDFAKTIHISAMEELGYVYKPSPSSMWRVLKGFGFYYSLLRGKPEIYANMRLIDWRQKYLKAIEDYRSAGAFEVHLDESWIYQGMANKYGWGIRGIDPYSTIERGYSHCFEIPPSHGKRAIVLAALTRNGVVPGSTYTFLGGRNEDGDYHCTIQGYMFENYFRALLDKIVSFTDAETIFIVMDNARYHLRYVERSIKIHQKRFLGPNSHATTRK